MSENAFGQYLTELRIAKSISQRKLAELAGVKNSTISRIEANQVSPNLSTIIKLSKALGVEPQILISNINRM